MTGGSDVFLGGWKFTPSVFFWSEIRCFLGGVKFQAHIFGGSQYAPPPSSHVYCWVHPLGRTGGQTVRLFLKTLPKGMESEVDQRAWLEEAPVRFLSTINYDHCLWMSTVIIQFFSLQSCRFGSRAVGKGCHVFNRRSDHLRCAVLSMVERCLNPSLPRYLMRKDCTKKKFLFLSLLVINGCELSTSLL